MTVLHLTDQPTIVADISDRNIDLLAVTLGDDRDIAAPYSGDSELPLEDGRQVTYRLRQDGTGTRVPTWVGIYWGDDVTEPTLSTDPDSVDYVTVEYDGEADAWYGIAYARGY